MCACTELPGDTDSPNGYAIVFDDITALLQAQRDAAWGEVARRLAHEIKNPLTPIQLSAERLRRKYLKPESGEAELLDRATHTIIQQVEAMKQMVNAFSEYARTPRMEVTRFDVNALITEAERAVRASGEAAGDQVVARAESAADRGRRRPAAAGAAQSAAQRARGDGASRRGARRDLDAASQRPDSELRRDQGRGQRSGLLARHRASSVRAVRHEQAQGNGAWASRSSRSSSRSTAARSARATASRAEPRSVYSFRYRWTRAANRSIGATITGENAHERANSGRRRRSQHPGSDRRDPERGRLRRHDCRGRQGSARRAQTSTSSISSCSTSGCPTPTASRCCANGRRAARPGTVVMMSGHGTVDTAVEATRLGAVDFIEKPVSLAKLLRTVERALAMRRNKDQRRGLATRRRRRPPARASRCVRCASRSRASRSTTRTRCSRASPAAAASCSRAILASQSAQARGAVRRRDGRRFERRERAARAPRRRHASPAPSNAPKAEFCSSRSSARSRAAGAAHAA